MTALPRFSPADVRAVMDANRDRLIAIAREIARHTETLDLSRKPDDRPSTR